MHHRLLWRRLRQALPRLYLMKQYCSDKAQVTVELVVRHEDAAPDDISGLADAFDGAAAHPEVHRRLALAHRFGVAGGEVRRRNRAGNLQQPDKIVDAVAGEM